MSKIKIVKVLSFLLIALGALKPMGLGPSYILFLTLLPGILILLTTNLLEIKKDKKRT